MFLITNNSIGVDIVSSEQMLKRHDTFDMDSEVPVRTILIDCFITHTHHYTAVLTLLSLSLPLSLSSLYMVRVVS